MSSHYHQNSAKYTGMGYPYATYANFHHELMKFARPKGDIVTADEAGAAYRAYQKLKGDAPDPGRVGRYAAVGAASSPVIGSISDVISGTKGMGVGAEKSFRGRRITGEGRKALGRSAAGAISMGLLPVVRHYVDKRSYEKTMEKYLKQHGYSPGEVKMSSIAKKALIERLVRLGATDIPNTPRLFMRHRGAKELADLQHRIGRAYDAKVTDPLMGVIGKATGKLPEGKLRIAANKIGKLVAEDPIGSLAANLVPFPGAHPAYIAGKKGAERLIDRYAGFANA